MILEFFQKKQKTKKPDVFLNKGSYGSCTWPGTVLGAEGTMIDKDQ